MSKKIIKKILTYFLIAGIGAIPVGLIGLILAPITFFIISKIIKNNLLKFVSWITIGLFVFALLLPALAPDRRLTGPVALAKKLLNNGIQECVVRSKEDKSLNFSDVESFKDLNISAYYSLKALNNFNSGDSCFAAKAYPRKAFDLYSFTQLDPPYDATWFEIKLNPATGEISKTCGDSSKYGCNEGNTW